MNLFQACLLGPVLTRTLSESCLETIWKEFKHTQKMNLFTQSFIEQEYYLLLIKPWDTLHIFIIKHSINDRRRK